MILLITITILLMILFGVLYRYFKKKWGNRSLMWKALATAMAGIVAFVGAVQGKEGYGWLILIGILFCMAADVFLEIRFVSGVVLFGCGHICFVLAYFQQAPIGIITVVCFLAIYGIVLFLLRREMQQFKELKKPVLFYLVLLALMVSMAITFWAKARTWESVAVVIGSICFLISDYMIGYRTAHHKQSGVYNAIILILYYGAVYMIGISTIVMATR